MYHKLSNLSDEADRRQKPVKVTMEPSKQDAGSVTVKGITAGEFRAFVKTCKVKRCVSALQNLTDHVIDHLQYNTSRNLIVNGEALPNTDIFDLLTHTAYLTSNVKSGLQPDGFQAFLEELRRTKVPQPLVGFMYTTNAAAVPTNLTNVQPTTPNLKQPSLNIQTTPANLHNINVTPKLSGTTSSYGTPTSTFATPNTISPITLPPSPADTTPKAVKKKKDKEKEKSQSKPPDLPNYRTLRSQAGKGLFTNIEADLCDFQKLKQANDNYAYALTCVDIWSRKVFAYPLKTKSPVEVQKAFEKMFTEYDFTPMVVHSDSGTEFTGKPVQEYFKRHGIFHSKAKNDVKCGIVERFNRTLKERIYKYFTAKATSRWVDVLDDIINSINHSVNRTIGVAPASINIKNFESLASVHYPKGRKRKKPKFKVGDTVRISKAKGVFTKGYLAKFTYEVFEVCQVLKDRQPVMYKIRDFENEVIDGTYYEQEMPYDLAQQSPFRRPPGRLTAPSFCFYSLPLDPPTRF
uniref:Integrase catalytic domain-containing protein n=1 Tax=Steinernema glaseri TaxID=37863 RepID=A0A1I7ZNI4_9BILA